MRRELFRGIALRDLSYKVGGIPTVVPPGTAIWVDLLPEPDQHLVVINTVMELTFDGFLIGAFVDRRNVRLRGPLELLAEAAE